MGQVRIEARTAGIPENLYREKQRRYRGDKGKSDGSAAALEHGGRRRGPCVAFPAFGANLGKGGRYVQRELVRFGILAGVIAAPAVVTEVGQLRDVAIRKGALAEHRRENVAIPLAIAAGIADFRLATCFLDCGIAGLKIKRHARRPPVLRSGRKPCRSSFRTRPDTLRQGSIPPSSRPRPRHFPAVRPTSKRGRCDRPSGRDR